MPRLAIGTVQEGADLQAVLVALLETLRQGGVQVQCFASQASLPGQWASKSVTGLPGRYLDSWLMSRDQCRELVLRSSGAADLAAVVGHFRAGDEEGFPGGSLTTLCDWLELPRVAVVDSTLIDRYGLPRKPDADAVLLDRESRRRSLPEMTTDIESIWGLPVLGALGDAEEARRRLGQLPPGSAIPHELCGQLGDAFDAHWLAEKFAQLVDGASPVEGWSPHCIHDLPVRKPTVAVAYDEAFFGYFPSTLDQLELLGAQVVDFSPLRDESLPAETDIVYLGCGRPDLYAEALAENHCMKAALRSHVACGRRVYGEVGGAAYLSQMLRFPSGATARMCGILPAVACLQESWAPAEPVEITVGQGNWLAPRGTRLRGYRSSRWRFELRGCRADSGETPCCHADMVGCNCVVGSSVHFHFAALPHVFKSFFQADSWTSPKLDPWRSAS